MVEIDTTSTTGRLNGQPIIITGAHDLSDQLLESGLLERCFVKTYFRYATRRIETAQELALIDQFGIQLHQGMPLDEFMIEFSMSDAFKSLRNPIENTEPMIDPANGQRLYTERCRVCHGMTGMGGVGPSLRESIPLLSDEDILRIVRIGQGEMLGGLINNDPDIMDVISFLRTWEN